jgi:hypothetical protein
MKIIRQVIATNSINFTGVFLSVYIYQVIFLLLTKSHLIFEILLVSLLSILFYGLLFWGIFFIGIVVLDFLIIRNTKKNLRKMLLLEWLIVSSPFIYWIIIFREWIFLVAVITFFITQMLREEKIQKIQGFL